MAVPAAKAVSADAVGANELEKKVLAQDMTVSLRITMGRVMDHTCCNALSWWSVQLWFVMMC